MKNDRGTYLVLRKLNHGSNSCIMLSYRRTENIRMANETMQISVRIRVLRHTSLWFAVNKERLGDISDCILVGDIPA